MNEFVKLDFFQGYAITPECLSHLVHLSSTGTLVDAVRCFKVVIYRKGFNQVHYITLVDHVKIVAINRMFRHGVSDMLVFVRLMVKVFNYDINIIFSDIISDSLFTYLTSKDQIEILHKIYSFYPFPDEVKRRGDMYQQIKAEEHKLWNEI